LVSVPIGFVAFGVMYQNRMRAVRVVTTPAGVTLRIVSLSVDRRVEIINREVKTTRQLVLTYLTSATSDTARLSEVTSALLLLLPVADTTGDTLLAVRARRPLIGTWIPLAREFEYAFARDTAGVLRRLTR
jgi:hypothetical protein